MTVDRTTCERRSVLVGQSGTVTASAISADGKSVCFGREDGSLAWVETRGTQLIWSAHETSARINRIAIAPDGERLAWCAADGRAGVLERSSGHCVTFDACPSNASELGLFGLGFTQDGREIITSGDEESPRMWGVEDGKPLGAFPDRPFGEILALGNGRDFVTVSKWSSRLRRAGGAVLTTNWGPIRTEGLVRTLRLSPDERFVLTASQRGVAELWNLSDGTPWLRYEHGSSPLTCAEFSPDGRAVATAAEDGSVRIWPVDIAAMARGHAPGTLKVWAAQMPMGFEGE